MVDSTGQTTRTHDWYQDLLGAYALGALMPGEAAELEAHLGTCPTCPHELRRLRLGVHAIALSAEERDPPPGLRDRLLRAVAPVPVSDALPQPGEDAAIARMDDEGGPATGSPGTYSAQPPKGGAQTDAELIRAAPGARPFPRPRLMPSDTATRLIWTKIAAALAIVLIGALIAWNFSLRSDDDDQSAVVGQFAPTADAPDPNSGGEIRYLADQDVLVLEMHDLPALGAGEVYQLWLVRGDNVTPSVTFRPGSESDTVVAVAADPEQLDALAITREPGPIGSVTATTPIILLAQV